MTTESSLQAGEDPETAEPLAWDVVAVGSFETINRFFERQHWSDGLPIVPPTRPQVSSFLDCCPDDPGRAIGVIQPSGSAVTVHNVAVNGVMAGCRPEDTPILVAVAEVLADPANGAEHSGDTTGGDAFVILSGPICTNLGFNIETGGLRDGHRANSCVGRCFRLLLRNVARSLPGGADKGTFGRTWRVVLAEHSQAVERLGWILFSVTRGFQGDEDVVTVARFTGSTTVGSIYGDDPKVIAAYLGDGLARQSGWEAAF